MAVVKAFFFVALLSALLSALLQASKAEQSSINDIINTVEALIVKVQGIQTLYGSIFQAFQSDFPV